MEVPLTTLLSLQTTSTMTTVNHPEKIGEPRGLAWALGRLAHSKEADVWSTLVEQVGPDIQRLAYRLIGDRSLAEDAVQETYLLIRDHAARFTARSSNGDNSARHWILSVATHASLQLARRHSRQIRRDRKVGRAEERAKPPISDPSQQVDNAEEGRLLRSELAELPLVYGQALSLHYFAGLDYLSLSAHLQVSVNTVRSRVNRGLKALREQLHRRGLALSITALTGLLTNLSAAPIAVATTVSATTLGLLTSAAVPTTSLVAATAGMSMTTVVTMVVSAALALTTYTLGWLDAIIPQARPAVVAQEEVAPARAAQPEQYQAVAPFAEVDKASGITVHFDKTPLKDALLVVQEASGVRIVFNDELLAGSAPITLNLVGSSLADVLLQMLRSNGFEAIMDDATQATIVHAWSDLGMAKASGRAVGIFMKLVNALDGAVVDGDEVRLPGWTAADDARLALGITDIVTANQYFTHGPGYFINIKSDLLFPRLKPLIISGDSAVRSGVFIPLTMYSSGMFRRGDAINPEFIEFIRKGLIDPIPEIRCSWTVSYVAGGSSLMWALQPAEVLKKRDQLTEAELKAIQADKFERLAGDNEALIRLVAAFAMLTASDRFKPIDSDGYKPLDFDADGALLKKLIADRSVCVRSVIPAALLAGFTHDISDDFPASLSARLSSVVTGPSLRSLMRDPNPIARAVHFALSQVGAAHGSGQPVTEFWPADELTRDPWMKFVHGLLAPMTQGQPLNWGDITVAVRSGKPSHQIVGLGTAMLGFMMGKVEPKKGKKSNSGQHQSEPHPGPDLAALSSLSDSSWLWARLAGVMADFALPIINAAVPQPLPTAALNAADARGKKALTSEQEPVRLMALLGKMYRLQFLGQEQDPDLIAEMHLHSVAELALVTEFASSLTQKELENIIARLSKKGPKSPMDVVRLKWLEEKEHEGSARGKRARAAEQARILLDENADELVWHKALQAVCFDLREHASADLPQELLKLVRAQNSLSSNVAFGLPGFTQTLGTQVIQDLIFDNSLNEDIRSCLASGICNNARDYTKTTLFLEATERANALPVDLVRRLSSAAMNAGARLDVVRGGEELITLVLSDARYCQDQEAARFFSSFFFKLESWKGGMDAIRFKNPKMVRDALDKLEKNWPAENKGLYEKECKKRVDSLRKALDARVQASDPTTDGGGF